LNSAFSCFWFSITILAYALILSQLQTKQLMTSKIRSHTHRICNTNF